MTPSLSPRGGSVIQGSFRGGRPTVLQLAVPATGATSVQAKAPLPFAATGGVPKPVVQAKAVIVPPPIKFPGQPPIQTKPAVVAPALGPARFTVPLPKPVATPKGVTAPSLQPKGMQLSGGGEAFEVPPTLNLASPGGGQPLPESVRNKMESFFGTSFADVRVHVGAQASSIGALAFTHGSNLYFAPGQYNPDTSHGQQLLGHELTHVVQQRAGRVRNPFGSGVAVVQDHAMEAEADRMGQRAASHTVQAKPAAPALAALPDARRPAARAVLPSSLRGVRPGSVQRSTPVSVSGMMSVGNGSYRIVVGAGGQSVGSVMVHDRSKVAIEVTDLAVDSSHRKQGLGGVLMASAMRAGLQMRKSKVTLASQDNGTGHLTAWYKNMGFVPTGATRRGYPVLEAPICRALSGVAQGRTGTARVPQVQPKAVTSHLSAPICLGSEKVTVARSDLLASTNGIFAARRRSLPRTIQRFVGGVIQRMQAPKCAECDNLNIYLNGRCRTCYSRSQAPNQSPIAGAGSRIQEHTNTVMFLENFGPLLVNSSRHSAAKLALEIRQITAIRDNVRSVWLSLLSTGELEKKPRRTGSLEGDPYPSKLYEYGETFSGNRTDWNRTKTLKFELHKKISSLSTAGCKYPLSDNVSDTDEAKAIEAIRELVSSNRSSAHDALMGIINEVVKDARAAKYDIREQEVQRKIAEVATARVVLEYDSQNSVQSGALEENYKYPTGKKLG